MRNSFWAIAAMILFLLCGSASGEAELMTDTEAMMPDGLHFVTIPAGMIFQMPDPEAGARAEAYLEECMKEGDSAGAVVECVVRGMPAGIGEPVFDKLDALLGQAMFSIGAVKGVEIGDGFAAAKSRGSENNDQYEEADPLSGSPAYKSSNHAGGILGGISDGSIIRIRAAFKPTPSISRPQRALGKDGSVHDLTISGRHDPLIAPRAAVVVECMTAIVILDLLMRNMSAKLENLQSRYLP